jgi:hypothetical protein
MKELGYPQEDSYFQWYRYSLSGEQEVYHNAVKTIYKLICSAPTVEEMLAWLKPRGKYHLITYLEKNVFCSGRMYTVDVVAFLLDINSNTLADTVIWVLEQEGK